MATHRQKTLQEGLLDFLSSLAQADPSHPSSFFLLLAPLTAQPRQTCNLLIWMIFSSTSVTRIFIMDLQVPVPDVSRSHPGVGDVFLRRVGLLGWSFPFASLGVAGSRGGSVRLCS